jgi:hypothetical protein
MIVLSVQNNFSQSLLFFLLVLRITVGAENSVICILLTVERLRFLTCMGMCICRIILTKTHTLNIKNKGVKSQVTILTNLVEHVGKKQTPE